MTAADILALDFDGVLCDGMAEYFETSRRTAAKVWPGDAVPGEELLLELLAHAGVGRHEDTAAGAVHAGLEGAFPAHDPAVLVRRRGGDDP